MPSSRSLRFGRCSIIALPPIAACMRACGPSGRSPEVDALRKPALNIPDGSASQPSYFDDSLAEKSQDSPNFHRIDEQNRAWQNREGSGLLP